MNFQHRLLLVLLVALLALPSARCAPITVREEVKLDSFVPHCTKTAIVHGEFSLANRDDVLQSAIQLKLGLNETACFRLSQSNTSSRSLLYTVRLSGVEDHHPITQRYQFAIPLITSSCICDCEGGENHCDPAKYLYGRCESNQPLCYRTYHSNQSPVGCPFGETSELCCEVSLTPYKDWRFWAIKIERPKTFATFSYRSYNWSDGYWRLVEDDQITMRLDGGSQTGDLWKNLGMKIQVSGIRLSNELESGMYFVRKDEGKLRYDVLVNALSGSRLDELGWYRLDENGQFKVQKDDLQMAKVQAVKVLNCKEQKYTNSIDADQFAALGADGETERFNLGSIVDDSIPWIASSRAESWATSRHVIVTHTEPNSIDVTLSVDNRASLQFVHNSSAIGDFAGSILLDSKSNRFINLSLHDASGILHGSCYVSDSKEIAELSFNVYVSSIGLSDVSTIVPIPSSVDASRLICLKADDSDEREVCHWLDFNSEPLPIDLSKVTWEEAIGHCPGCNEITLSGLLNNLDPRKWFQGISSISELATILLDAGLYFIVFLVVFMVVKNCIFPVIRLMICPVSTFVKR